MEEVRTQRNKKQKVVARMTITFKGSAKSMIVEVHDNSTFSDFYRFYSQVGRKRKQLMRTANRNEGITPHHTASRVKPGLEVLAERMPTYMKNINSVHIKVFKKRVYNRMLNCAPDQLGALPKNDLRIAHWSDVVRGRNRGIPVRLPTEYLTFQKRMNILTGAN